ncbi:MAG: cheBR [Chthonomonadaceae bacterium]|nr:cheBR [Chthonomonadaceae bacterium]
MDNSTEHRTYEDTLQAEAPSPHCTLVGLGASAGGIRALQTFFEGMPEKSGMAFVVVMHLSPDHESNLTQILQQRTTMPVVQVTKTVCVEPDHVYVIPPGKHLSMQDNSILLVEPQQPTGRRVAVDLFFRALSVAYGPKAVCVVLSGTDSDGAIGIKHVKEQGGLTIVQDPSEAEFDGMPRMAISTGMVDWVLPVAQMPLQLMEFMRNEQRMHVPPEETPGSDHTPEDGNSGGPVQIAQLPSVTDETALMEVLRFLRGQTGHDFAHYKRATILRRVARRLQVNLLENVPSYLDFLRTHPTETTALLHDMLISVTNFFRNPDAFAALESQIPQLFADKAAHDQVRVWVAGCATGEEAYSVTMLLSEHAGRLEAPPSIQVFATDLDEEVVQIARTGVYPATIEADVSPERLRRFFLKEEGRYRIRKEVRERVLFSVHNLIKDPPFSRLDLITCRNLLIYLKHEAQEAVFDLFHFALRPGGLLLLGSSESVSDDQALFVPLDKQHRLFVRQAVPRTGWKLPVLPLPVSSARTLSTSFLSPAGMPPNLSSLQAGPTLPISTAATPPGGMERRTPLFGDLHLSLLEQFAPPSLIVNAHYDIVHLSEHAGRFLHFTGDASMNLLKAVHPALRVEMRTALFRATRSQTAVSTSPILLELDGKPRLVTIHIRPTPSTEAAALILVVFEPTAEPVEAPQNSPSSADAVARHLDEENQHLKEQLSATVEQYEASLEELKASNEELQSMNEETRSTAEELETSKEELQSINEELTTVNQELKSNVEESSRNNGDLQNLMASTEIGTIFLDRQLRIKRFTPRIQELFNIIPTDIGRPLSDLTHKLTYAALTSDAERVLCDLQSSEREVSSNGRWFLGRILPYRTVDDHIDGVVLTFVDITERKRVEEVLRERQEEIESLNARLRRAMTETHHRVKNNLQLMSAFIGMQTDSGAETVPMSELVRLGQNIQALGVVHDILTQEAKADGDANFISVKAVLGRFLPLLQATLGEHHLQIEVDEVRLPANQVTSLTLIVNELVSNAIKHGRGEVNLRMRATDNLATLEVSDDGPGFADSFDPKVAANTGLELIENIVRHDLKGTISYRNRDQGGGHVLVTFQCQPSEPS